MKKVFVLCAFVMAFATMTFAQAEKHAPSAEDKMQKPEMMAGQKPESWKDLLGLTKEQDVKMKEIGKSFKEKSNAVKADATLDKAGIKAKMQELQASNEAELKTVLTPEQFTKYVDIKKQRKEMQKAHQGEMAPKSN